jgi:hypothetical protein
LSCKSTNIKIDTVFLGGGHVAGVGPKAPIKTGKGKRMKESYGEGFANHTSLNRCIYRMDKNES